MVEKAVWEIGKFVLNKGQSGAGGRTFNDKILFKGFREGEKYVSLGTSPTWGCGATYLNLS